MAYLLTTARPPGSSGNRSCLEWYMSDGRGGRLAGGRSRQGVGRCIHDTIRTTTLSILPEADDPFGAEDHLQQDEIQEAKPDRTLLQ